MVFLFATLCILAIVVAVIAVIRMVCEESFTTGYPFLLIALCASLMASTMNDYMVKAQNTASLYDAAVTKIETLQARNEHLTTAMWKQESQEAKLNMALDVFKRENTALQETNKNNAKALKEAQEKLSKIQAIVTKEGK